MSIGETGGIGSGNIPPYKGNLLPASSGTAHGPKTTENRRGEDSRDSVDIRPEREVERLVTQASLYGSENERIFLQTPEHVFTTLLALPELSAAQRVQLHTTYERWKTLRQVRAAAYPLPVQPVSPIEPVGDREAEPDFSKEDPPQKSDAHDEG